MIKTLEVSLGEVRGLSLAGIDPIVGQQLAASGYYYDPITGQKYYYNAVQNQWFYVTASGLLQALSIVEQSAPKTVSVKAGDSLKISISYSYSGPAITGAEQYFSIGTKDIFGYHPKFEGTVTRNFPICGSATLFTAEKTLLIPSNVGNDWTAIECKVWHGTPDAPETGRRYLDALVIVGLEAVITGFTIVDYVKA